MALSEKQVIDQISADEYGNVSVRTRTDVVRNGDVIASTYHRRVIHRDDRLDRDEDARVVAVVEAARQGVVDK